MDGVEASGPNRRVRGGREDREAGGGRGGFLREERKGDTRENWGLSLRKSGRVILAAATKKETEKCVNSRSTTKSPPLSPPLNEPVSVGLTR